MEIEIRDLGLAAYIRIIGGKFVRFNEETDSYVFVTDICENDWRVAYLNSESYKHDTEIMSLRTFKQRKKRRV